jgi:SAM-dependent methyltransferase
MKLSEVQQYWDRQAHTDPMWAAAWGKPVARRSALDFGCGIGRLTHALAEHFDQVYGVDISPGMIELARLHNRKGARVEYVCNPDTRLGEFANGSIDMIYSWITLQHVRPRFARRYMSEFLRVLAPGGLLLFQYPSKPPLLAVAPGSLESFFVQAAPDVHERHGSRSGG